MSTYSGYNFDFFERLPTHSRNKFVLNYSSRDRIPTDFVVSGVSVMAIAIIKIFRKKIKNEVVFVLA